MYWFCCGTNAFHCNPSFPVSTVLSSSERLVPVSMRSCRSQLVCQLPLWRSWPVVNTPGWAGTVITHRGHIHHLLWVLHINSTPPPFSDISPLQETEQGRAGCVHSVQVIPPKVITLWSLLHNQTKKGWQHLPGQQSCTVILHSVSSYHVFWTGADMWCIDS